MKHLLLLGIALASVAPHATAQSDPGREVAALEDAWARAAVTNDVGALEKLLADDLTWVSRDGRMYDKPGLLAMVKSADNTGVTGHNEDYRARVVGDVVVITGIYVETRRAPSGPTTTRSVWTDTWVKRGGRWLCIASHNTTIR